MGIVLFYFYRFGDKFLHAILCGRMKQYNRQFPSEIFWKS